MFNELKQITKSQKMRALVLFMVLAIVAVVVVFAIDGAGEYQENDGYTGHYYEVGGVYDYGGYEYGDIFDTYHASIEGEYCIIRAAFDEYMYNMAGEAGEAPAMLILPND